MRSELEESADNTIVQKELQKKRDEDHTSLKSQVEEEAKEHEVQMGALRQKHNQLVEDLNSQLDQIKRNKTALG